MNADCDHVTPECPVELTLFGDYFTIEAVATYAALFGLMCVAQIYHTWRSKMWSFGSWLFAGTVFELLGYIFRCMMVDNPWNGNAFIGQQTTLVLGPTLVAAAISVTFKHLVVWHGPEYSLIRPKWYPIVFVGSDLVSIMVQGAGGGLAASGDSVDMQKMGNDMMLGGVIFQVINMVGCGFLILSYVWRRKKAMKEGPMQLSSEWQEGRGNVPLCYQGSLAVVLHWKKQIRIFVAGLTVAYIAILVRCCYRIVEMQSGWGSDLMKNEATFLIFDGALLLIACGVLTVIHPAIFFKYMSKNTDDATKEGGDMEMNSSHGLTQPESMTQTPDSYTKQSSYSR